MLTRKLTRLTVALCGACCFGCGALSPLISTADTSDSEPDPFQPPTSDDDINSTWTGLDDFVFLEEGPDATAWKLVREHRWEIYKEHEGGAGDTLQIVDPTAGIRLIWGYNSFLAFILSEGWTGQTANGAGIGTRPSDFAQLYPEFTGISSGLLEFGSGSARLETEETNVVVEFREHQLSKIYSWRGSLRFLALDP